MLGPSAASPALMILVAEFERFLRQQGKSD